jgi:hypothetical protein
MTDIEFVRLKVPVRSKLEYQRHEMSFKESLIRGGVYELVLATHDTVIHSPCLTPTSLVRRLRGRIDNGSDGILTTVRGTN